MPVRPVLRCGISDFFQPARMAVSKLCSLKKTDKQKIRRMWIFERFRTGVPGAPAFALVTRRV
jgi:hypothetical protein